MLEHIQISITTLELVDYFRQQLLDTYNTVCHKITIIPIYNNNSLTLHSFFLLILPPSPSSSTLMRKPTCRTTSLQLEVCGKQHRLVLRPRHDNVTVPLYINRTGDLVITVQKGQSISILLLHLLLYLNEDTNQHDHAPAVGGPLELTVREVRVNPLPVGRRSCSLRCHLVCIRLDSHLERHTPILGCVQGILETGMENGTNCKVY